MHRGARIAALALALSASGCVYRYTSACIRGEGAYARCLEEDHQCRWVSDEEEGGWWECDDGAGVDPGACTDYVEDTRCRDEGFPYLCEGTGLWYPSPCPP